jgi:hypothetical protein
MATTLNRAHLRRMIERGELVASCDGIYTDDYAQDEAANYRRTDWMPARVRAAGEAWNDAPAGCVTLDPRDFCGLPSAARRRRGLTFSLAPGRPVGGLAERLAIWARRNAHERA